MDPIRCVVWFVVIGTLTGCTGGPEASPAPVRAASPPAATDAPFVRTCDSRVFGSLGNGWTDDALVAGPVFFVGGGGRFPAATFDLRPGKSADIKLLLVIHGTDPVTISIPPEVRDATLLYDPEAFNSNRLELGDRAVTFEPCGGGPQHTQFNGGIGAIRPICLPLDVTPADAETIRVRLPLGEPC